MPLPTPFDAAAVHDRRAQAFHGTHRVADVVPAATRAEGQVDAADADRIHLAVALQQLPPEEREVAVCADTLDDEALTQQIGLHALVAGAGPQADADHVPGTVHAGRPLFTPP